MPHSSASLYEGSWGSSVAIAQVATICCVALVSHRLVGAGVWATTSRLGYLTRSYGGTTLDRCSGVSSPVGMEPVSQYLGVECSFDGARRKLVGRRSLVMCRRVKLWFYKMDSFFFFLLLLSSPGGTLLRFS